MLFWIFFSYVTACDISDIKCEHESWSDVKANKEIGKRNADELLKSCFKKLDTEQVGTRVTVKFLKGLQSKLRQ